METESAFVQRLHEVLSYDPTTGVFVWRVNTNSRAPAGSRAGYVDGRTDRRYIGLDCKVYEASRLAWFFVYGQWPRFEIDHVNVDAGDDRLKNLREATRTQNGANRRPRHGVLAKGVDMMSGRYRAQITVDKKTHYLGMHDTVAAASDAYARAATSAYGAFARTS